MAGRRIERLNEQLKREVTDILRNHARDPRIGLITVTRAQSAPDLSFARIFVSVYGDDEVKQASLEGLAAAAPFVRSELSKRLMVRRVPELRFEPDLTLEHALHIEKLLGEVKRSEAAAAAGSDPDRGASEAQMDGADNEAADDEDFEDEDLEDEDVDHDEQEDTEQQPDDSSTGSSDA